MHPKVGCKLHMEGGVTHNFYSFVNQWLAPCLHRGALNVNTEMLFLFTGGHAVTRIDILMHEHATGEWVNSGCQNAAVKKGQGSNLKHYSESGLNGSERQK